jgi:hypothetical protein
LNQGGDHQTQARADVDELPDVHLPTTRFKTLAALVSSDETSRTM